MNLKTYLVFIFAGFLFSGCAFFSTSSSTKKESSIRIVSYNIRHGAGMDGKIDLQRISAVISKMNPDLVALQEVDKCCRRSKKVDIAARLAKSLGMQYRFGKFMNFQGGEYGMAVLSRFPILKTIRHQLPRGKEPRCALEVVLKIKGLNKPLSFVSIHNDWVNEKIRQKQIKSLLKDLSNRNNPIILAGDFNCEKSDISMRNLKESGWRILDKNGEKTYPSIKPNKEIDYVVLKNFPATSVRHGVIAEKTASDHRPIYAVISYMNEAEPVERK